MESTKFKKVGIWLDHSFAYFVGYADGKATLIEKLDSPHESMKRVEGEGNDTTWYTPNPEHASNNEHKKHNITQNELKEYFKILEGKIQSYEDVLLFGPGTAKEQLRNRLKDNKAFDKKWFAVENSDKLTDNQLLAYVREFFDKHSI
ncbi:hypothetical protein [Mongoliitalea lutea]|nr:hypothetical protein [Mongoliitalea lutea]